LPVSARLVTAFAARARSLEEPARAALTVAAVAGNDLRVVAQACALLDIETAALAAPEAAGLIRLGQGRVEFTHPLVRAAVYTDTTPEHRRAVHQAVADALGPREPDRRAWHLAEAVIGPADDVADLLRQAADRASGRSAHHTASAALERAAALSSSAERHAELCVAAAESAWLAGASTRATALLDEAAGLGAPAARLPILRLRGAIAARTGSLVRALDTLRSAAGVAAEPDTKVMLLADAISVCFYLGDGVAAVALAEEVEELLGKASTPWPRGLGQIAAGMARVLVNRGGIDQVREAVDLLAAAGTEDQRRLPWLMIGPLFLRDTGSSAQLRQRVGEARARATVGTLPLLLFHVARDEATTNQWARAEATYDEAIALARETGQDTELAMCLAGLAWLLARLGREQQCRALVTEALPLCRDRDIHVGRIWSLFALGELELGLGNAAKALVHLDELQSVLDGLGVADPDLSPVPERTDLLIRLGRRDDARQAAARFEAAALAKGQPWAQARAARTAGILGEDDELDRHFLGALELHAQTLDVFETARTQLAYGVRLRRARRRADARPHLRSALACFEDLRAQRWADLAVHELQATGETTRRQASHGAQTLTPQELQVSLLLAEGRTTREVAAALFLSPKTVEYHLRKVYTKLGIRSRAELARELP
jgi:DNA-binding CsgD family transcriptional regulator